MTTIGPFFCLLCLSIIPHDDTIRESADLVELNSFFDENGRLVFDQIIFYEFCEHTPKFPKNRSTFSGDEHQYVDHGPRFYVIAWRLVKLEGQVPVFDYSSNNWVCMWQDGEVYRQVYCKAEMRTWTQTDPELVERELLPKEGRKELRKR